MTTTDAVVIGAGPNGLVAANLLVDAGWSVMVIEANDAAGGAVRSTEVTAPGFMNDLFSAFYPLAAASPVIRSLQLEDQGLKWSHAPAVLAHPSPEGTAILHRDLELTQQSLDGFAAGDGAAWAELYRWWRTFSEPAIAALFAPFPPIRAGAKLAWNLKLDGARELARTAVLPVRRLGQERFGGTGAGLLLAGCALHADLGPEQAGSGLYGWLMASLGQQFGFPVPEGGAQRLTDALVARLRSRGGDLVLGTRVQRVIVEGSRVVGVETADGTVRVRHAVLADVAAPALFLELVGSDHLPSRFLNRLQRNFEFDPGTVKVDWARDRPIPWEDPSVSMAGTVHLCDSIDDLSHWANHLATGELPVDPFLLMGQMTTADPTRSPPGTESAWAYTHVPRRIRRDLGGTITGRWDEAEAEQIADRIETSIERRAPGFRTAILARHIFTPPSLEAADSNLVGGAIGGGTAQIHQQLVFRPVSGWGRPETPVTGLFLASASAHPGGGVHGAPGANAARAAISGRRRHRLFSAWPSGPRAQG